ncbi:MAG: membrane protein insertase YidC [Rhodobacteraceae bacterium]|nr:membrane protein insertase YidC [Paracoccaceae bacterium]
MNDQNKNLILATVLSILVLVSWSYLFPQPEVQPDLTNPDASELATPSVAGPPAVDDGTTAAAVAEAANPAPAQQALAEAARISIDTPELSGSISLFGGRIDELRFKSYREENVEGSDIVTLFSPEGEVGAYYALYGWAPAGDLTQAQVPGPQTLWQIEGNTDLTAETPVSLIWDNGAGMIFRRQIAVDNKYMFAITQSVENTGNASRRLAPYGVLRRHGEPENLKGFFILHEGAIRQSGEEMAELDYKDLRKFEPHETWGNAAELVSAESNGWIGFTDHYWMTTLIPASDQSFDAIFKYYEGSDTYTAWSQLETLEVAAGASASTTTQLFAGAKEWETIRDYEDKGGVYRFIDSIDWGWFFFLTKPMFALLHWLNGVIGNMGWSIIALTVVVKAALLPLAYKSYVSMAKMKELQPEMEKLKERVGDDKQKLQQEMMALYKKEKVNPASGCLPIFLQIPIFFSLYKVIFVTLELRHAPWLGWIQDLSAPDPSSILNLFGLLSFVPPEQGSFLAIISLGILPILLGISMWLQQKLNPAPTDATQAMIFAWMPWVFMFMLGQFASGLVLYWITSNTLTFIQQYTIMRSHGHRPDVFGNILKSFKKKPKEEK